MFTLSDKFSTGISALESFVELLEVVDSVFSECSVFEDVDSEVDAAKSTKCDQEKGHDLAQFDGDLQMLQ